MSLNPSSIIYGLFQLKNEQKHKYAVILHNDNDNYIITTFTTSQKRAGKNPTHGKNKNPECYVFKANTIIGICPSNETDFYFKTDTIIVPDYGLLDIPVEDFLNKVTGLKTVCHLHKEEYINLLHFLYQCKKTKIRHVRIFENILMKLST